MRSSFQSTLLLGCSLLGQMLLGPAQSAVAGEPRGSGAPILDFDTSLPVLPIGTGTPFDQTAGWIAAHVGSPGDGTSGPAYRIENNQSTHLSLSLLNSRFIAPTTTSRAALEISFDPPIVGISLAFATGDLSPHPPSVINLSAYLTSSEDPPIGTASAFGVHIGDSYPEGILSFSSIEDAFRVVRIEMSNAPGSATFFFVDNIEATLPPGMSPSIVVQPVSSSTCSTNGIWLNVYAGGDPLRYQWQAELDTDEWTDLVNGNLMHDDVLLGVISGALSSSLSISSLATFNLDRPTLNLRCVVYNPWGNATSEPAVLTVWSQLSGDANDDGMTDAKDIEAFVSQLYSDPAPSSSWCACDLTADGIVDIADIEQFVTVLLLQETPPVVPAFSYSCNHYEYDQTPGDNDLPWLRQFAIDHNIFQGVNMSLQWKDREWDMMKAIIYYTSHTFTFTGVNTQPDLMFRAKDILNAVVAHPEFEWSCGSISQVAIGLALAHGIPARAINGRIQEDPCAGGDYCCEMYSTRFNRWVFLMPHIYAWIEHSANGPLGVAELRDYDRRGKIQVVYIQKHEEVVIINGQPVTITIPDHYDAVPSPPLVFRPSKSNMAPIPPYMTINWWSGYFKYMAVAYVVKTQQAEPLMAEAFSEDYLNQVPCSPSTPVPVVASESPDISYILNNIKATAVTLDTQEKRIQLSNNMIDFDHYEIRQDAQLWHSNDLPQYTMPNTFIWTPGSFSTLTIRGVTKAGATSPEVVISAND